LSIEEALILRLADQFDCLLWCTRELALGNRNAMLVWRRTCASIEYMTTELHDYLDVALRAANIYEALKDVYHEVTGPTGPNFDVYGAAC
jgi:hypothetical protein